MTDSLKIENQRMATVNNFNGCVGNTVVWRHTVLDVYNLTKSANSSLILGCDWCLTIFDYAVLHEKLIIKHTQKYPTLRFCNMLSMIP